MCRNSHVLARGVVRHAPAETAMRGIDTSLQEFGEFLLKATLATRAPETRATHAAP
jgi:hypothetical protein